PRALVFALELNTVLNQKKLSQIAKIGFSRIPVFKKNVNNIKGILYTKDLALMKKNTRVKDIYQKNNFLVISKTRPINKILNKFFKKRLHLAIVVNKTGRFEGVITLEDIIEEIFKIEILDEKDVLFNSPQSHRKTRKKLKKISQNMLQQSAPLE
ncbi:CBS domain-containing protein, partial [Patescibacteria group bacterium]|nr:CBS domain-containing protein [Patescibacteria group bacterium]